MSLRRVDGMVKTCTINAILTVQDRDRTAGHLKHSLDPEEARSDPATLAGITERAVIQLTGMAQRRPGVYSRQEVGSWRTGVRAGCLEDRGWRGARWREPLGKGSIGQAFSCVLDKTNSCLQREGCIVPAERAR
ncbi:hypothetical protein JZ751_019640 [Albula glossodonta]|uniref:Uncharacterized protein n=1 Tax=Albula glossodonta TaxID=121402 RepID=A0A8T2NQ42_9TELE|nr:hypothetical protein JZ751_019640 [Albula glossodonta]